MNLMTLSVLYSLHYLSLWVCCNHAVRALHVLAHAWNPEVFCSVISSFACAVLLDAILVIARYNNCFLTVNLISRCLFVMDDTILSLKTQLLEREREIAALKKKLHQVEKVCSRYSEQIFR